ncbi:unnamed protein product [Closterium sp. NIES-54]
MVAVNFATTGSKPSAPLSVSCKTSPFLTARSKTESQRAAITRWHRSPAASSATPTHHSHSGGTPSTMPPSFTTSTPTRIFPIPLPPHSGSEKHPLLAPFGYGGAPMSSSTLGLGDSKVVSLASKLKRASTLGITPTPLTTSSSTPLLNNESGAATSSLTRLAPFTPWGGDPSSGPPSLVWTDFDAPPELPPAPAPSASTSLAIAPSHSEVSDPSSPVPTAAAPSSLPSPTPPTALPPPSAPTIYHRRSNPPAPPPPFVPPFTQEPTLPQSPELITYQRRPIPPPKPPKPTPLVPPAPPSSPVPHGTRTHGAAHPLALAIRYSVITLPPAGGDVPPTLLEDRHEELCDLHVVIPQLSHIFPDITESPSLNFSENPTIPIPLTVQEAISGPHAAEWRAAMEAECEVFTRNHSFDDETPPPGVNIVGGKWLLRVKQLPGEAPVFKARYVAKGFTQQ